MQHFSIPRECDLEHRVVWVVFEVNQLAGVNLPNVQGMTAQCQDFTIRGKSQAAEPAVETAAAFEPADFPA